MNMDFETIIQLLALKAMETGKVAELASEMVVMSVRLAAHGDMSQEHFLEMTEGMIKEFNLERERHLKECMKSEGSEEEQIDALNVADEFIQRMRNQTRKH